MGDQNLPGLRSKDLPPITGVFALSRTVTSNELTVFSG
jgi:hypothetical protein